MNINYTVTIIFNTKCQKHRTLASLSYRHFTMSFSLTESRGKSNTYDVVRIYSQAVLFTKSEGNSPLFWEKACAQPEMLVHITAI